jgi:GDP-4-dehydro-6-deoxy-D-mannose reductase
MRIMVTGAAGFIGTKLSNFCSEAGCKVLGVGVSQATGLQDSVEYERCDVRSPEFGELVALYRPDRVFHLAAQSYPTVSLVDPLHTMDVNSAGTIRLFESVRGLQSPPMIVVACSSAEYGTVQAGDLPVREDHPLQPLHPYGVSKVAQDLLAFQYYANYKIPCARIRIFNTTGPGKVGDVCADLTERAAKIEEGLIPAILRVGNLNTRRALLDVRDMVRALWMAADAAVPGEAYNVGGNQIIAVEDIIGMIRARLRRPFIVEQDASLVRACDEPVIAGDTTKFRTLTGCCLLYTSPSPRDRG